MSEINIHYPLDCHKDHSKQTVQKLLFALKEKYSIDHDFINDHQCTLTGSGVSGQLNIEDGGVEIYAKLGFLMMPFKNIIESEIINKLNESFQ